MQGISAKLVAASLLALAATAYVALDIGQYLDLARVKQSHADFALYYAAHPLRTIAVYFSVYVLITALSIPGASVVTLAGGALFGLWIGIAVVWAASSIGATLAFWSSRYLLRDWLRKHFHRQFLAVDQGMARDGLFFLFGMRLLPMFPFFLINLLMGLTAIRTWPYYWVSAIGMFCGTVIYVNAGTRLATITGLRDIATPGILGALVVMAVFPFIAKKLLKIGKPFVK